MLGDCKDLICYNNNVSTIYEIWLDGKYFKSCDSRREAIRIYKFLDEDNAFIRECCECLRDYKIIKPTEESFKGEASLNKNLNVIG